MKNLNVKWVHSLTHFLGRWMVQILFRGKIQPDPFDDNWETNDIIYESEKALRIKSSGVCFIGLIVFFLLLIIIYICKSLYYS